MKTNTELKLLNKRKPKMICKNKKKLLCKKQDLAIAYLRIIQ